MSTHRSSIGPVVVRDLSVSFRDRTALSGVDLVAQPGRRIGLVGENGTGKSTLLRAVAGRLPATARLAGTLEVPADVVLLGQEPPFRDDRTIGEVLAATLRSLREAVRRVEELAGELHDEAGQAAYAAALEHAVDHDAWDADRRAEVAAHELGLGELDPARAVGTLSGGERTRLALATVMTTRPAVLLLDEPTNHLDDGAIDVLARFLLDLPGVVLLASHDRVLLDDVCTDLVDLDPTAFGTDGLGGRRFGGGWSDYVAARDDARRRWEETYDAQQEELDLLRAATRIGTAQIAHNRGPTDNDKFIYKFKGGKVESTLARRKKDAQRRLGSAERDQVRKPPKKLTFRSELAGQGAGGRVVQVRDLVVAGRLTLDRLDVEAGGHLLVTGANGSGKSTLLAVLAGRLAPTAGSVSVGGRADERGVDVRGLIWRSHWDRIGFFSRENRTLGEQLQDRGAEALLDMRVRIGGSHHQKFVVIRHRDDPARDVAYVGGIDLAHSRRDDHRHLGDPQADRMSQEYGDRPPWHDAMVAITGPAVHDVETTFRERWEDPSPLSRRPDQWIADKVRGLDRSPDPLPEQHPPPPLVEDGTHVVQLLRTYPNLRQARDYPFAPGGERSVARAYAKAAKRARRLIYVEDQYFWGNEIASTFLDTLVENADLHLVCLLPLYPDLEGSARTPQLLARQRAIRDLMEAAPGRVAAYGLENEQGTPIYVHAKICVIDDVWATTGSDNFNRRSWTHDSELTAAVVDRADGSRTPYARALRLRLAAEHLGRLDQLAGADDERWREVMADCIDPGGMVTAYAASADALESWHSGGRVGERPPGRLRRQDVPDLPRPTRAWSRVPLRLLQDPDGRPWRLRKTRRF